MKKSILFLLLTVIMSCCKENIDQQQVKNENFKKEFVSTYGEPQEDHMWGFDAITRSADVKTNMWDYTPAAPTRTEIEKVKRWFDTHYFPTNSIEVDWMNFYVQHISSKHSNMDWLYCGYDDHIANFNANAGSVMKMVNSTTLNFGYHNSLDNKMHNDYYIKEIDGQYYVGFDFSADGMNPNQRESPDGLYNDWIVKISPAYSKIIIAEDLGVQNTDFDYNDVVFGIDGDVVTLLAAGGTLPLYIDGNEVHNAFGVSTKTMVNTYSYNETPPVQFRIQTKNINDIPIKVGDCNIPWFKGQPSAKICVDADYVWTTERESIDKKYPKFKDYVKNQTIKFWK